MKVPWRCRWQHYSDEVLLAFENAFREQGKEACVERAVLHPELDGAGHIFSAFECGETAAPEFLPLTAEHERVVDMSGALGPLVRDLCGTEQEARWLEETAAPVLKISVDLR